MKSEFKSLMGKNQEEIKSENTEIKKNLEEIKTLMNNLLIDKKS